MCQLAFRPWTVFDTLREPLRRTVPALNYMENITITLQPGLQVRAGTPMRLWFPFHFQAKFWSPARALQQPLHFQILNTYRGPCYFLLSVILHFQPRSPFPSCATVRRCLAQAGADWSPGRPDKAGLVA